MINCAAISQPAACEREPAYATALNVPTKLLDALQRHQQQHGSSPLLIHFSTDQVYEGTKAFWREGDDCNPVNAYGKTKLAAEQAIQVSAHAHVNSIGARGHRC